MTNNGKLKFDYFLKCKCSELPLYRTAILFPEEIDQFLLDLLALKVNCRCSNHGTKGGYMIGLPPPYLIRLQRLKHTYTTVS